MRKEAKQCHSLPSEGTVFERLFPLATGSASSDNPSREDAACEIGGRLSTKLSIPLELEDCILFITKEEYEIKDKKIKK